jgi:hypothetical protein
MESALVDRFNVLLPLLSELQKRLYCGAEAKAIGRGGISLVSRLTGVSRNTIAKGMKEFDEQLAALNWNLELPQETELSQENELPQETKTKVADKLGRSRKKGGGRKLIEEKNPEIIKLIKDMIDPYVSGSPVKNLTWVSKSTRHIAGALKLNNNINISHKKIGRILNKEGYRLQVNKKSKTTTKSHEDRNQQFTYINELSYIFADFKQPVISIDAKKKENIGNFKNNGKEYCPKGNPTEVLDHDFMIKDLGKATPYGVLDIFNNYGFVNLGITADTGEFAVESIRRWCNLVAPKKYSKISNVYIIADSGGSNGSKLRLWKYELQKLANELDIEFIVSHLPPGASKWNKIEHRLFSFITKNWRGRPLISLAVMVELISATKTSTGLKVECIIDENDYHKGIKISDAQIAELNIIKHGFHDDWNYSIIPTSKKTTDFLHQIVIKAYEKLPEDSCN